MPIMFNEIKITLHDPPGGAYCAGETISGEMRGWNILIASVSFAFIVGFVELNIRESNTNARGLRMIVLGTAHAEWSTRRGNIKTTHRENEYPLHAVTYLFGSENAESEVIAVGARKYDLTCKIPPSAPYSVEGRHGYIRYKVQVNLDTPWAPDLHTEKAFTVYRNEDLTAFPNLNIPVALEETKIFCAFPCNPNSFVMTMKVPKQSFVVGEKLPVKISLVNQSSIDIFYTTLSLERWFHYQAQGCHNEEHEKVAMQTYRGAKSGERVTFDAFLMIPRSAFPSIDKCCHVFKVSYILELRALDDGCCSTPIVIGNVAFQTAEPVQPSAPVEVEQLVEAPAASTPSSDADSLAAAQPTAPLRTTASAPNKDSDLPPSFNEAMPHENEILLQATQTL